MLPRRQVNPNGLTFSPGRSKVSSGWRCSYEINVRRRFCCLLCLCAFPADSPAASAGGDGSMTGRVHGGRGGYDRASAGSPEGRVSIEEAIWLRRSVRKILRGDALRRRRLAAPLGGAGDHRREERSAERAVRGRHVSARDLPRDERVSRAVRSREALPRRRA